MQRNKSTRVTRYSHSLFLSAFQALAQIRTEIDNHQKNFYMELVSDCWLFVRLQVVTTMFLASLVGVIIVYRHSFTSHMAGLCLTSAILIMSDVFLFTRLVSLDDVYSRWMLTTTVVF